MLVVGMLSGLQRTTTWASSSFDLTFCLFLHVFYACFSLSLWCQYNLDETPWHPNSRCFLMTLGRTSVEPVLSPVVNYVPEKTDDKTHETAWWGTCMARWTQLQRHALGFSDFSYYFMMLPLVFSFLLGILDFKAFGKLAFRCISEKQREQEDFLSWNMKGKLGESERERDLGVSADCDWGYSTSSSSPDDEGLRGFWRMLISGTTLLIRLVNVHAFEQQKAYKVFHDIHHSCIRIITNKRYAADIGIDI